MPLRWKSRFGTATMLASAFLAAGCHEPKEIVPVAPPGLELARVPKEPQAEAVALGEQPGIATPTPDDPNDKGAPPTPIGKPVTTPTGLTYETLKEGAGAVAKKGQQVEMHYIGRLEDGTVFDKAEGAKTFKTAIGRGSVIPGWDQGVPGMLVGERRKLTIPSSLGYGAQGSGSTIPGGATLIFEVELVGVQ